MKYIYPDMGNDPELFITAKGKVVPAEELVPMEGGRTGLCVAKVDNAAVELNFPPSHCLQVVNRGIAESLRILKSTYLDSRRHRVLLKAAVEMSEADMRKYRSLMLFGCDPSLLFYDGNISISKPLVDPHIVRYRSTGFHVHIGMDRPEKYHVNWGKEYQHAAEIVHSTNGRVRLVQMCDLLVGLPAVFLERDTDAVHIRRNLLGYGRAGEFREQPHGFEYRTLGPWPLLKPSWAWWANAAVRDAFHIVQIGADEVILKATNMKAIADAINSNDIKAALVLWPKVKKAIADLVQDKDYESDNRHPMLSSRNIKFLEFAIADGGITHELFHFSKWLRGADRWVTYAGFPNIMSRKMKNCKYWDKAQKFSKDWQLTKDNLSEWL